MISDWLAATRPQTLPAGIAPVALGTALAAERVTIDWLVAGACLLVALLLQMATNFANDALDARRGADGPARLGPRRAVASGAISEAAMLRATILLLLAALLCGLWLTTLGGWPILLLGLLSLSCTWGYTGGPFPLAYHGLGDLFVLLFFGLVAVLGSAWLQLAPHNHPFPAAWWLPAAALGCQATAIIAVNNWRDRATDAVVGKRTLAVRLAAPTYHRYHAALHGGAGLSLAGFALWTDTSWLLLPAGLAALGGWRLHRCLFRHHGPALNTVLARSAALEMGCTCVLITILRLT